MWPTACQQDKIAAAGSCCIAAPYFLFLIFFFFFLYGTSICPSAHAMFLKGTGWLELACSTIPVQNINNCGRIGMGQL